MNALPSIALVCGLAALTFATTRHDTRDDSLQLGSFSLCLAVKDIEASKAFYEKLDFEEVAGDVQKKYVVLQNGTTKIALIQGMIDRNVMTFNPGVTQEREPLEDFQDVRDLQHILKERGIELQSEADETTDGPASFTFVDPDGNPIYVDQYVPRPGR